jgi:DNA-binding PadR family transcriptional regulator
MYPGRRRSPLALAVLSVLEIGALHPYAIQRLLKMWGKDQVINVGQRATLYRTITHLHAAGLIEVVQTERDQRFPERTVYQLTDAGRQTRCESLNRALATPRDEFPEFPAALSFTMLMSPEEATDVLSQRATALDERVRVLDHELESHPPGLPRVTVLETEYVRSLAIAERDWVNGVIDDLRSGQLTWGWELADLARSFLPDAGITTPEHQAADDDRPS